MVTIKDIAKKAGVSPGTVDRVLHNRGGVSKTTEHKIRKILKENNYKVNVIASTLALRKKYHICNLIPRYSKHNLFWKSPLMGILKAAEEVKNYGIHISNHTYDQYEPTDYLEEFELLLSFMPDAVIMVPTFLEETKAIVSKLEKRKIPYTFLNIDVEGFNNISFIGQDSYKSGYLAGKLMHLCMDKGASCLTIQTRFVAHNYYVTTKRSEGFKDFFKDNGIPMDSTDITLHNLNDSDAIRREINSFLEIHSDVHGIFVPSSRIATIANCIETTKMKRLRLIGFDTTPQNITSLKEGKITFLISQKSFDQGYRALQQMTAYLINGKIPDSKSWSPIDIIAKENLEFNHRRENLGLYNNS